MRWRQTQGAPKRWRHRLPLDFARGATRAAKVDKAQHSLYNAVHFNLDCDWLLYLEKRFKTAATPTRRKFKNWQLESERLCSRGADASLTAVALRYVGAYVRATQAMGDTLPVLVATSIGKDLHTATQWVLDAYQDALPNFTFFKSGAASPYREVNAAAELSLLLNAESFIGLTQSTFSGFIERRLQRRPKQHRGAVFHANDYLPFKKKKEEEYLP